MHDEPPEQPASFDVIKFEPPAHVRLVDAEDLVIDKAVMRWDQLVPDMRAAVPNPWHEGKFLLGHVRGQAGMMLLVVGESFGQLEWVEGTGWICHGLVKQSQIWNALGAAAAADIKDKSFTQRLTRRAAKKSNK